MCFFLRLHVWGLFGSGSAVVDVVFNSVSVCCRIRIHRNHLGISAALSTLPSSIDFQFFNTLQLLNCWVFKQFFYGFLMQIFRAILFSLTYWIFSLQCLKFIVQRNGEWQWNSWETNSIENWQLHIKRFSTHFVSNISTFNEKNCKVFRINPLHIKVDRRCTFSYTFFVILHKIH